MNDEALIRRLAAGSRTALNQAVDRFTPYVSAVAWRVLAPSAATRENLEEVVADVFLALWSHAMDIDPGRVRTWPGAVAKNKAVDRLRTLSPTLPLCENAADRSPGPEEETLLRERAARLLAAVEALEEPDRTLFLRRYYANEKLKDVARDLGMNQATARTRLHRGRRLLLEQLMKGGDEP